MVTGRSIGVTCVCALIWLTPPARSAAADAALERHRNLGKAFFENPATHAEAIAEFKKALDLAPNSVREKLNYALALLHGNRVAEGVALLEQVQRLDPSLPHTWFNLGVQYKKSDKQEKALAQFETLVKLAPREPIAHYQVGAIYRGRAPKRGCGSGSSKRRRRSILNWPPHTFSFITSIASRGAWWTPPKSSWRFSRR